MRRGIFLLATDGEGTVLLTWQNLLVTGCDVFFGESMARSTDGGRTFSPGVPQELYSHAIVSDGSRSANNVSIETLEAILRAAKRYGVRVIGFDEIGR